MKAGSRKYKRPWYCACCGEKYEPGKHLQDRLLVIVPPGHHRVKESVANIGSSSGAQSSNQASS
eukprot:12168264-Prorocentrum_lima.AAC.1